MHRVTSWLIYKQLLSLDFAFECALACGGQRTTSAVIPHKAVHFAVYGRVYHWPKLIQEARLGLGQRSPVVYLSLPTQSWHYKQSTMPGFGGVVFCFLMWVLAIELRPLCLEGKHFTY